MFSRLSPIILVLALLAGCASLPKRLPPLTAEQPWLSKWSLTGKLGLRSRQDGGTFTVIWHQNGTNYTIDFQAPLAQGSGRLVKTAASVTYYASDGSKAQADNAAMLLRQETGLVLPIASLAYWLQAKPSPLLSPAKITRDKNNYPSLIQQDNWKVTYHRYKQVGNHVLPTSLTISEPSQQMLAKMVIRRWEGIK